MKNKISILAIAMFLFTAGANAQETKKDTKKATTETMTANVKSEVTSEKKECAAKPKKGGCCAHKKEEAKSI